MMVRLLTEHINDLIKATGKNNHRVLINTPLGFALVKNIGMLNGELIISITFDGREEMQ